MAIDYESPSYDDKPKVGKSKPTMQGRRTSRSTRPKAITLEEAIETLQALGFSISVPTSTEEKERQEASLAKLGFSEASTKPSSKLAKAQQKPTVLTGYLYLTHTIAEATYGPGEFVLPIEQSSLYRSLLQQDQTAVRSLTDTADRQPYSRCYLITPGRGQDNKNKFSKLEVSQDLFDSDNFINNVTVRAGATDIAGAANAQPSTF